MSTPIDTLTLTLGHITLAAQAYGPEDGLPVIALHGWLDNANSFARLAPALRGLRIVALDLAGHGLSDHRPLGASYALSDYAYDVLCVAECLGWSRYALLGHSLGALIAIQLAAAMPERISHLALIDGLIPPTTDDAQATEQLALALRARLRQGDGRRVYPTLAAAAEARQRSHLTVSAEAAQLLAERGTEAVPGGYSWRSDKRLTLPSPTRLTPAQAWSFVAQVQCPSMLVVAEQGVLRARGAPLERLPFAYHVVPGGHHVHLDDAEGADLVADCINRFFARA